MFKRAIKGRISNFKKIMEKYSRKDLKKRFRHNMLEIRANKINKTDENKNKK